MIYWTMRTTRKLYLGFGILTLLILSIIGYTYYSFEQESKAIELNIRTYEIMRGSDAALTSIINMETGARGFVIAGVDSFLEPYILGKAEFQMHIAKMKELTAHNLDQQKRIERLLNVARQWDTYESNILEVRRKVNSGQATIEEVVLLVRSGEGKRHTDEMRSIVADFVHEEEGLLEQRAVLLKENEAATRRAMLFGGTVAIVLAGIFSLMITLDIREKRRTEIELECARDSALEASIAKSQFLSTMSHEIRTPMNAIIGMADLLWETPLTTEQEKYIRVFRTAGENLLGIINDILDISKIEAGYLELEETDFDLEELIGKTCDVLSLRAHEKGIELAYYINSDVQTRLIGDPGRLKQIVINLIGNAIKFTEKGEIVLEIATNKADHMSHTIEKVGLVFTIRDTGIGIPEESMQQIFEQFTQVDASTTRKYGGTGLGLAICKRLVEKMNGEMQISSKLGLGSTFKFTAEFSRQAFPKVKVTAPAHISNQKILIVDDNDTNRLILKKMLAAWGSEAQEAESGKAAICELEAANKAGVPYTLLLLDGMMPEMDGFQVAEYIKMNCSMLSLTIMMLTSDCRNNEIARCDELGIASYLIKPIKRTELFESIIKAVSIDRPNEPDRIVPGEVQKGIIKRILLVDDSSDNRMLILAYLKKTPYQVDTTQNGLEAVQEFMNHQYDLVLMDMQMPVMDGYAATRKIREWEKENKVVATPILALTAYALKEDVQKSLEAGCDYHLAKPIRKNVLLQTMAKYIEEGASSQPPDINKTLIYVDQELQNIVPAYLTGRNIDIHKILDAVEVDDFESIRIIGHTLKGTGGGYGFTEISNIGVNLEKAAIEKDSTTIYKVVKRLEAYITNLEVRYR